MKLILKFLVLMTSLSGMAWARFDAIPTEPSTKHRTEERGVNNNLASLFLFCDAVVVGERNDIYKQNKERGYGFLVKECLWSSDGKPLTGEIYLAFDREFYQDNRRNLDSWETYDEMRFHYLPPVLSLDNMELLFLRRAVIDEKVRQSWKLGDLLACKVVNGGQGCVQLYHMKAEMKPFLGGSDERRKLIRSICVKNTKAIFGSTDHQEIERFVRDFYAGKLGENGWFEHPIGKKLREDALSLVLDVARPVIPAKKEGAVAPDSDIGTGESL